MLLATTCLVMGLATPAAAPDTVNPKQWLIGASIGAIRYWGGTSVARGENGELAFSPYRPTPIGIRVEVQTSRFRFGISLEYAEPGLGASARDSAGVPSGTIVLENFLTSYTLTPQAGVRIARLAGGAPILAGLGLLLERWDVPGEPSRHRVGVAGTLGLELHLFGDFVGAATATVGWTPSSPFRREELPPPYRPASLWRRGITATLSYRL